MPSAVAAAFRIAGVVPIFLPNLNRDAWLSASVTSGGLPVLAIDDGVTEGRLREIADQVLSEVAQRTHYPAV